MFQIKDGGEAWYLIHCQSRKEKYASRALESQLGLSIFLPECKIRARGEIRTIPFFPGYIFIRADLQLVSPSRINATPGVIRLVSFGDEPQPVPLDVIEVIRERLTHIDLVSLPTFKAGDVVRVKQTGPLQDLEMVFVGSATSSRRVTVLLNLLGRLKEVHLDVETLEKVVSSSSHMGEKYARVGERKAIRSA